MRHKNIFAILGSLFTLTVSMMGAYAQEHNETRMVTEPLAENLYLLQDFSGMGNSTVLTGPDGLVLIDTKTEGATGQLLAEIAKLSKQSIRFVIITHWHFDHIGGNEEIAETGAAIVAHEHVRKRMSQKQEMPFFQKQIPAAANIAQPIMTFTEKLTFHLNGEEIVVTSMPGHTDGDAVVYFTNANVLHIGDFFFNGVYPYIDVPSGGTIERTIAVINQLLPSLDENSVVVPGHGPRSNKARLQEYVAMLTEIRDSVRQLIQEGKTMEEVIAAKPTQPFDEKWGKGFLTPDRFTELVFMDLSLNLS